MGNKLHWKLLSHRPSLVFDVYLMWISKRWKSKMLFIRLIISCNLMRNGAKSLHPQFVISKRASDSKYPNLNKKKSSENLVYNQILKS
ncbi:hypothetical protein ZOSMA_18G00770 [Zostera marina]|uniref:Uncharacterized protein n=1 Tax=Zostera marina TaxID=29655 RepID=A0A0K9PRY3_ZOSMR|nr:hypothetical protein ZOSMA_18G00770 [Zostera marina]